MKNSKLVTALFLLSLSAATSAKEASFQELICETESKFTQRENDIFRDSLIFNKIDNYANIAKFVEPLQAKSRLVVNKNCLAGKDHRVVASEIKQIWTEGCDAIANPALNQTCKKFMPLNDGSNIEKMLKENPALAELIKRAKDAPPSALSDCSPGVSTDSVGKEQGIKDLQKTKDELQQASKQ